MTKVTCSLHVPPNMHNIEHNSMYDSVCRQHIHYGIHYTVSLFTTWDNSIAWIGVHSNRPKLALCVCGLLNTSGGFSVHISTMYCTIILDYIMREWSHEVFADQLWWHTQKCSRAWRLMCNSELVDVCVRRTRLIIFTYNQRVGRLSI